MQESLERAERWKPVNGYEGIYEVSSHGRVRSVDRTVTRSDGRVHRHKGKLLRTPLSAGGGYPFVQLSNHGKTQVRTVHSLVAGAFIGTRPEGTEVCHNDGNPTNNHLDNLRYGTPSENELDKLRHGTHTNAAKTHCPRGHELFAENIPPSLAKRGYRECLACKRARDFVRHHPELKPQLQAITDSYYQTILEERKIAPAAAMPPQSANG